MKIFLDDQGNDERRSWAPEDWRRAINFLEFKELVEEALRTGEVIEAISFDNDLGDGEKDGWEVLKWLSETHPEMMESGPELSVHSANPEGRKALEHHIDFWRRNYKEMGEAKSRPDPWAEIKIK
ncbi:MAG: hypothetical protein UW46_C0007G0009 [Candidatus Yanofskybacteria bacterium GW2011_GWF1_44_227]|uniref:Cyclic-phosphate processing Receiver domain-containing protein n=1 Tax=Candidatus Yanofskybacteria bacterium GW2011_GWE2_40_11 TaxID=1619033 RepID=A0A0G0SYS2_9BACT|nr:MAG: hypothetical protein UT75_C0011G0008 [Candidatus Yanofskybacteria bacterium GW2011_GWE2_40_11]KKT14644.1 MAG: hypothetical protein UV97_C0018G0003 [Candidatus Yanofskybacteria bacterium GW2011_GWF2_43_596]KKT53033.1 MAG: hypothetical protein UW46_C0007G0009 [Candidatus Yanofskybacteria bacterium GW2011_GWF1_44_227]OGN35715.1 MAG: hypothetical protein A2241_02410 [Candidatus Yanofskybacteria bacterium RIFOXYA2_FULL_45_28]OGN35753.1 MAG: hypothetical protein A2207_01625 [Candidatus Yanofs